MHRRVNVIICSLCYTALAYVIVFNNALNRFFTVPLPIGLNAGFPVPVLFWLSTVAYWRIVRIRTSIQATGRVLVLGVALHLCLSLVKLMSGILHGTVEFASPVYQAMNGSTV